MTDSTTNSVDNGSNSVGLEPAAYIARFNHKTDSAHTQKPHWVSDSRVEPCFAASGIEGWFEDLLLAVEKAVNEAEVEDHAWAFKVAMVELRRRDFEDLQNPVEAAEEVVQSLEVDD
ncbi:hypothetical protein [Halococcus sediminicola]|uniref:hypothetical protein n=1 Tax=Halococcus sediminicola TaxID=1264579 RepID=UPI0012AB9F54|nr:hypothetical protein [Halococcus sediminicola]